MNDGALLIRVPVQPSGRDFRLRVVYQGCADKGLCYPPQTAFVDADARDGQLLRAQWRGEDAAPVTVSDVAAATAPAAPAGAKPAAAPAKKG